jgi:hypothetical protein
MSRISTGEEPEEKERTFLEEDNFWQLEMVEADRAKADSGWLEGKETRGREGLCFWEKDIRKEKSSVAQSFGYVLDFHCV